MALGLRAWGIAASVSGAMLQFLAEHLQPGGHFALEVGEVRNGRALLRCDHQIDRAAADRTRRSVATRSSAISVPSRLGPVGSVVSD